jgi:cation diffusion facilitator family transporter
MTSRENHIRQASWVGIAGNGFLSACKITVGLISGSLAVVADGVDSMTDIVISIITLITANIISRPPNMKYPYGYGRADTIATKSLSFIIFFAGAQMLITSVKRLIMGGNTEIPSTIAVYVIILSIVGKALLALYQTKVGKRTGSPMLVANGKNMQNDVLISGSVLLGLVFTFVLKLPLLDTITALLVSLWVLRVALKIFMQTSLELMDGTKDCTIYDKIFEAIDSVEGVHHPHRVRSRNIGEKVIINIDLEVDGSLTLVQAHELAHEVEDSIRNRIDNVFDVSIHVEPLGDKKKEKAIGITKSSL